MVAVGGTAPLYLNRAQIVIQAHGRLKRCIEAVEFEVFVWRVDAFAFAIGKGGDRQANQPIEYAENRD